MDKRRPNEILIWSRESSNGSSASETDRRIILQPIEDGWWLAEVPSLPGCLSQGETRQAALENVQEAIELYIECLIEDGEPIPADVEESTL